MTELEQFELLKKNILSTDWAMMDAPYHGFTGDNIRGVQWAIKKILNGTGITFETLSKEEKEKGWFTYKPDKTK